MNGKDQDIETFVAYLEIENNQPCGKMKVEELRVANIDDEVEQQPLRNNELSRIAQKT
jgi:hypothetical protein